jgi:hypothetical protein
VTTSTDDLKKAVAQATEAVAAVNDPELRKAAFEKILEKLLGGGEESVSAPETRGKRRPKNRAASQPARTSRSGPQSNVEELIDAGFFKKPKLFKGIMEELEANGHHLPRTTLSPTLLALCRAKKLRRRKVDGAWEYSNW